MQLAAQSGGDETWIYVFSIGLAVTFARSFEP